MQIASIGEIKKLARLSLKGKWGVGVLLTIILMVVNMVVPMIVQILFGENPEFTSYNHSIEQEPSFTLTLANFIASMILVPFNISVYWFYLSLVRYENPQISQVFKIFTTGKTYFKLIGLSLVSGILVFLWTLLLIIPGIIKCIAYSQAYYLLRDKPELSILEAITESRKRMDGHKWRYFLLSLSFIGWAILSIITFGIGYLWLAPYISASLAAFYNECIADPDDEGANA